jgi:hypothetical protein
MSLEFRLQFGSHRKLLFVSHAALETNLNMLVHYTQGFKTDKPEAQGAC